VFDIIEGNWGIRDYAFASWRGAAMPPAKHGGVAAIGKAFPGPGPPRVQFFPAIFLEMLKMLDRCERCGANLALVGLRHRRIPRRYDAPPVTRPTVTETKRNAKDRTAAERMRRYRARERW